MVENIEWQWARMDALSVKEWHEIVSLRQAVFVVEQECPYLDADVLDLHAWHLIGWVDADERIGSEQKRVALAYLRVVDPGHKYAEPSIGRVLTRLSHRRLGLGKALMGQAMHQVAEYFPGQAIRISAQKHLQAFYNMYGFAQVGDGYDEDGIPHIEMIKTSQPIKDVSQC